MRGGIYRNHFFKPFFKTRERHRGVSYSLFTFVKTAKPSASPLKPHQGIHEFFMIKIGPECIGEVDLGIGALPE